MSVLTARLDKLAPALSAKERAVLALRRHTAGLEPDPELTRSMPREQARQYDRYAGLAYVANAELGALCRVITTNVEMLEFQEEQISLLGQAATQLEEQWPDDVRANPVRGWRKRSHTTVPEFLRGLEAEMRQELHGALLLRHKELRALESVWAEIAAEFDGEDVAHPDLRRQANQTMDRIRQLARKTGKRAKTLPEPETWIVEDVRAIVDRAFEAIGLIERHS